MNSASLTRSLDADAALLVEQMIERMQSGESNIEELIAAHPEHADTLRRLAPVAQVMALLSQSGSDPASATADGPSGTLGDFRLIREVGRGGMGIVYEAEQISLNRRVALKVLPFAATMDPRHLQRFRNEAQAAACLHHANIVPVFGVGVERGVHYYAMQLIDGQTLAEVISGRASQRERDVDSDSEDNHVALTPRRSPSTAHTALLATKRDRVHFRTIAELVASAADALEYAHSMGVLHRDIKPGNLMLDNGGQLWITDFGLAKLANPGREPGGDITLTGDLIGTLRFMSPEAALARHGLVDHRTDIYALGATLYEMLTLRPAVPGADKQEILKAIAWDEPTPLRKIDKSIPPELETITLKCLAKEPGERYSSAKELGDDLRRWQGDAPIKAKAAGWLEKSAKWGRRHRALVAAFAIVVLMTMLLCTGLAVSWQQRRAAVEHEVELALEEADRHQKQERWSDALSAARRAEGLLATGPVRENVRARVVSRSRDLKFAINLRGFDDQVRSSGGANTFPFLNAYAKLFRDNGYDIDTLNSNEVAEQIAASSTPLEIATALDRWGMVIATNGMTRGKNNMLSVDEAKRRQAQLLAIARVVDPHPYRNRLRDALSTWNVDDLKALARSDNFGEMGPVSLHHLGQALTLAQANQDALELYERAQRQFPGDFAINHMLAAKLRNTKPPRLAEALRFFTAAIALFPKNPSLYIDLGVTLDQAGDQDGAIEATRAALRLYPGYSYAHLNIGTYSRKKGDIDGGIRAYREGLTYHPDSHELRINLGSALLSKGMLDESAHEWRELIRIKPDYYGGYEQLAEVLFKQRKFDEARSVYRTVQQKEPTPEVAQSVQEALKKLERLAELHGQLPELLSGKAQFASNKERVAFADQCVEWKLNCAALKFFNEAFKVDPGLNLPVRSYRYNAACAGVQAGCGQGHDVNHISESEKSRYRQQALEWLTAELNDWTKVIDNPEKNRDLRVSLVHWTRDPDLSGVRGQEREKLPEDERIAWKKLWDDVRALYVRAGGKSAIQKP